jgi:hypothetical protein
MSMKNYPVVVEGNSLIETGRSQKCFFIKTMTENRNGQPGQYRNECVWTHMTNFLSQSSNPFSQDIPAYLSPLHSLKRV